MPVKKHEPPKPMDYSKIGCGAFMKVWIEARHMMTVEGQWFFTLRQLCELNPELLTINGNLHNNLDGSRTYLSGQVKGMNGVYHNFHIYGIATYNYFKTTQIEIFLGPKDAQVGSVVFDILEKPKDNGSVASE